MCSAWKMLSEADIQKYGGKAVILNYIRDHTGPPIPKYVVKEAGFSVDTVLKDFSLLPFPIFLKRSK